MNRTGDLAPAVTYDKNVTYAREGIYALARMAWPTSVLPSDQAAPGTS